MPWQGDHPLHTPYGTFHFKAGVSLSPLPEKVIARLQAIYGNKVEVLDENRAEDQKTSTNSERKRVRKKTE